MGGPVIPRLNPWDRQPGETDPAWAAFVIYRNLGLERSTAKVRESIGKSQRLVETWSSRWSWVLRAHQWDAEQDREFQTTLRHKARLAAEKHIEVANQAMELVASRLQLYLDVPGEVKVSELAQLANVSLRMHQAVLGATLGGIPAPMTINGKPVTGGDPLDDLDLDSLSPEEVRFVQEAILREAEADVAEYARAAAGEEPIDRDPEDDQ